MPRPLWKGAISFGLVNVPVELHPAARSNTLDLTWLDRRSMDPVGYQRINKRTGKEVPKDDIVKGYEYKDDRYVVLGPEDFRRANPTATQTVEILAFVDREQIAPLYFENPYYLVPGKRGEKAYALLLETMKRANRAAVASVVIATRQHLAAMLPFGKLLLLNTLRYADEIRDTASFSLPSESLKVAGVSEKEIDMALKLVESMADDWKPQQYHDTYREDILTRVSEKIKKGETEMVAQPSDEAPPRPSAKVIDLVALLQGSLRENGKGRRAPGKEKATVRRAAAVKNAGYARVKARRPDAPASGTSTKSRERKRA